MDQAAAVVDEPPRFAGFWIRVGAALVDTLVYLLLAGPVLWAVYGPEYFTSTDFIAGHVDFVVSWVLPAVGTVVFWLMRRATPGKILLGLEVVDARSGATLTTKQAIGRYLGYFVSIIPLFLGLLWVAFDARKQGWHDKLAGTVVVIRNKN